MISPPYRDISIFTQVVFKEFVNANGKLPTGEDWDLINKTTQALWKNTHTNLSNISDAIAKAKENEPPF